MAETAVEIRHDYAEVNDVRSHDAVAGAAPLSLFLHGFPEFWREWQSQLAEFGRDHRAVAPDPRGCNLSSWPEVVRVPGAPYWLVHEQPDRVNGEIRRFLTTAA